VPVVVLFQMLFEEGYRGEFLVELTGLAIYLDEALVLSKFLEGFLPLNVRKEDIAVDFIGDDLFLDGGEGLEFGHNNHLLTGSLRKIKNKSTLQMGQVLFLLITLIL
jgi:hypothetical protein